MYKPNKLTTSNMKAGDAQPGETIEQKVRRIVANREPIKDGAALNYSERKDGVYPEFDIRTDKMEEAVELADKVTKTYQAQRDGRLGKKAKENMEKEAKTEQKPGDGKAESTPATDK